MSEKFAYRAQIVVAVIGLLGVLGGALIANWGKVFPKTEQNQLMTVIDENKEIKTNGFVHVYYFPTRKSDAIRVKATLEKEKYMVSIHKAGSDIDSEKNSASYILYTNLDLMLKAKIVIENILGQQFNVSQADPEKKWAKDSVLVILTSRSNDP